MPMRRRSSDWIGWKSWLGNESWNMKTARTQSKTRKRLKYVVEMNGRILPEDTDPDYLMSYIDISNVETGGAVGSPQEYRFADAPSRARRLVKSGDTVISTVRTYLKAVAFLDRPSPDTVVSTGFAVLTAKEELLPKYLFYHSVSEAFVQSVVAHSVGVSYPAISPTDLGTLMVQVPPKEVQRKIAAYLDEKTVAIDSVVEKKRRLVELLKEKRAAIINRAVTKGLDPKAKLDDSGVEWIGQIPKGWSTRKLKFLTRYQLQYGLNESGIEDDRNNLRFIRITDIDDAGRLREESFASVSATLADGYVLRDGDILFARSGATAGKSFQYRKEYGNSCFAGYLIRFTPDKNRLLSDYVRLVTQSNYYEQWKDGVYIQATIQNISAEKYKEFRIALPPLIEQEKIVKFLEGKTSLIDTIMSRIDTSIDLLTEYKYSLITNVVTGKMKIA